jgi:uncharacterized membrane protein
MSKMESALGAFRRNVQPFRQRGKGFSFLSALMFMAIFSLAEAYIIEASSISVEVLEAISIEPSTVEVYLKPGDKVDFDIKISNAGSERIRVTLEYRVEGPSPSNVDITFSGNTNVPGQSSSIVTMKVKAGNDLVEGTYTIKILFRR